MESNSVKAQNNILTIRPPIAVVMGHVDHGKTKLLDYIRKTNVAEKESGGITQHIGAYEVIVSTKEGQSKKITFLDTPGHKSFSKMRSRGARIADIAILVVAADEGIKPQTKEALAVIQNAEIPFIVALNKIDKVEANSEKVKKELAEAGVLIEEWGGKVPLVPISAKTGQGVSELLEMVLLVADLEDLKANAAEKASGVVIEAYLDPKRGNAATLIIQNGALKLGQFVVSGRVLAPVRIFEDFAGHKIKEAGFGRPVKIVGFSELPEVGMNFAAVDSKKEAEILIETAGNIEKTNVRLPAGKTSDETKKFEVPIIIKADVSGSLEAIEAEINKIEMPAGAVLNVLYSGVGSVTQDDIKLVSTLPQTVILAFRVGIEKSVRDLADRFGFTVQSFEIIYEIVDWLKAEIEKRLPKEKVEKITGKARILQVFKQNKEKQIIGGRALEGVIKSGRKFHIKRRGNVLGDGRVFELQHQKVKASEVEAGKEFGLMISSKITIAKGDEIEIFEEEEIKPTI
ncbi:MAG: translation initiation factor IF-2 [Patescibacteria group bacterium]